MESNEKFKEESNDESEEESKGDSKEESREETTFFKRTLYEGYHNKLTIITYGSSSEA